MGEYALSQGCEKSAELSSPLAMSNALLGNWQDAKRYAQSSRDPWGFNAVVLTAEGLRRGDRTKLNILSETYEPAAISSLEEKALELIERSQNK